jgi:hypothetical protein
VARHQRLTYGLWSPDRIIVSAVGWRDSALVSHEALHDILWVSGYRPPEGDSSHRARHPVPPFNRCATEYYVPSQQASSEWVPRPAALLRTATASPVAKPAKLRSGPTARPVEGGGPPRREDCQVRPAVTRLPRRASLGRTDRETGASDKRLADPAAVLPEFLRPKRAN